MKTWFPYGVLIALLAATAALTAFGGKISTVSEAGIVMSLPAQVGVWNGEDTAVTELELRGLPRDTEFARKRYWDAAGHEIFCSIVLAGKHSQSIHRPETCLPSQGWTISDSRYEQVPLAMPDLPTLTVRALKIFHPAPGGSVDELSCYWFVGKDRLTASHFERIFWNSYDRVVHNVNHRWAYITVTTALPNGGTVAEARASEEQLRGMVREFIRRLFPELKRSSLPAHRGGI